MAGANRITRSVRPVSLFESAINVISSAVSFDQGDFLYLNGSNLLAKPAAETDGNKFLGIARVTVSSGKLATPYSTATDAANAISDIPGPITCVVVKAVLKSGDAVTPGALVYLDPSNGTHHVQAAGTKSIGISQVTLTGDGTKEAECLIGYRFPTDTLEF